MYSYHVFLETIFIMKAVILIAFFLLYGVSCAPFKDNPENEEDKMLPEEVLPLKYLIKREIQNENDGKEMISTAESNNNYVYRPLFTYRRIEHSKRRITMYNSFLG